MNIRDFGVRIGKGKAGERDLITDVPGVRVGQTTVTKNRPDGTPLYNTGVTVILPCDGFVFDRKPVAACYVQNGYGKTAGTIQLNELGTLESPIALTNTLNVGIVSDALVEYMLQESQKEAYDLRTPDGSRQKRQIRSVNVVVGETNDSLLNTIADRAVTKEDVFAAIGSAGKDFEQGDVGAGRGTVCCDLKGGIGSASRILKFAGREYTIGALVQSNFGSLEDLMINGESVGKEILARGRKQNKGAGKKNGKIFSHVLPEQTVPYTDASHLNQKDESPESPEREEFNDDVNAGRSDLQAGSPQSTEDVGSIMIVIGTDLPLTHRQLERVLKRASVGLVRTGSFLGHGSGDIFIGFTTGNCMGVMPDYADEESRLPFYFGSTSEKAFVTMKAFPEDAINRVFRLAAEAVEESILNSLINAHTLTGPSGNVVHCLRDYWPVRKRVE